MALCFKGADLVGVLQGELDFVEAVEQVVFAVVVYAELAIV